jgi:hypothetical protein
MLIAAEDAQTPARARVLTAAEFRRLVPVCDATLRAYREQGMPHTHSPGGRPMYLDPDSLDWLRQRTPKRVG